MLWRAKSDTGLPVTEELPDRSYLSYLVAPDTRRRGNRIPVRVVEYTLQATESEHPHKAGQVYRLVTTILDPEAAPAEDLAEVYAQRWEIESVFDEIKTHRQAARPVLRSRDPDGVEREIWGILLLHHALRDLIHTSARDAGIDPNGSPSPAPCVPPVVSATGRDFPPSRLRRATSQASAELLERLNTRGRRHNPRVVRRTHRTPFPAQKPIDRHLVQPPPGMTSRSGAPHRCIVS